jgi:hypothetical protein
LLLGGVLGLLLLSLVGCGSKGTLHGKATFKGQPLPVGTRIVFLHEKTDRSFYAEVQSEGAYSCEAIPSGKVRIGVQVPTAANVGAKGPMAGAMNKGMNAPTEGTGGLIAPPPGFNDAFRGASSPNAGQSLAIPPQYTDPRESALSVDVKGGKQEFNIDVPAN